MGHNPNIVQNGYNFTVINRQIQQFISEIAQKYPVLTITGPRQVGKTFISKHIFSEKPYFNLEDLELRDFAISDPRAFLSQMPDGGIIDEIQYAPDLLSYIQVEVDEKRDLMSQFILTGSQQFSLMQNVSQSLAGRTAVISLLPCTIAEILDYENQQISKNSFIYQGFYPAIYKDRIEASRFYADYLKTYIERDLNQISQIKNLSLFRKFMRACASRVGQLLNKESLANDIGIDGSTVESWLSILETSFVLFRLEPYFTNTTKRLVKSPKLYFYDVGLASHLLDIESVKHVESHPLKGNLFENMVVMEFLKSRFNQGKTNNLNFYRDKSKEVDLILREAAKFSAVEVKYAETIKESLWDSLNYIEKLFPDQCQEKVLVYGGSQEQNRSALKVLPFTEIASLRSQ